jgi:predicted Zn-dependent protease
LAKDRIEFVREHVQTSPWSDARLPDGFESDFAMVRAKLRGFLDPSSVTLQRVAQTDPSPTARYARAIALYRLGHTAEAVTLIDGLLHEQPSSPWLLELKGQVLFEGGRGAAAIPPYQEAVRLAPGHPLIRAALGRALIETGDPAQLRPAIGHLTAALAREHDEPDDWRALGTAYGKIGDLANADLALAEEALLRSDIRTAKTLANRAAKALKPGPAQIRALDIANAVKKENREGF